MPLHVPQTVTNELCSRTQQRAGYGANRTGRAQRAQFGPDEAPTLAPSTTEVLPYPALT